MNNKDKPHNCGNKKVTPNKGNKDKREMFLCKYTLFKDS